MAQDKAFERLTRPRHSPSRTAKATVSVLTHVMGLVEVPMPAAAAAAAVEVVEEVVGVLVSMAVVRVAVMLSRGVAVWLEVVEAVVAQLWEVHATVEEVNKSACCCHVAKRNPATLSTRPMTKSSIPWPKQPRKGRHGQRVRREGRMP
jgi:hypothetical protein